ncbi:MAG: methyl-accepting chemotaxis protein [Candidatus Kapaibacterium sp.]
MGNFLSNMKISTRLYLFIGGVVLLAFIAFGLYLNGYISETLDETYNESITEYLNDYTKMINLEVTSKQEQVELSVNLAEVYLNSLGNIRVLDETVNVGGKEVQKWEINGVQVQKNYSIVDKYTDMGIDLSSIFQKTDNGYVRISTSVVDENSNRAIGSVIPNDSPIALEIDRGNSYIGRSFVLGTWLIGAYKPIMINGKVAGIIAVAVPEINYSSLSEYFAEKNYFGSGYPYIVDANGILTAHPQSVGTSLADRDFFKEIKEQKNGTVTYDWEGREKTQYFKYIDAIDSYATVGWYTEDYEQIFTALQMIIAIAALIAMLAIFFVLFLIVRPIVASIKSAVGAADSISKGNIDVDLKTNKKDETGMLLNSMEAMAVNLKGLVNEFDKAANAAVEGKLDSRADESAFEGEYRNIMAGFNHTLDAVISPLNVTAEYVDRISKGDIPPKITDEYKGDFNEIKNNLNLCIDAINNLVNDSKVLTGAAAQGKLDVRADASKHYGDFREIVDGVNSTLDNVIGPLNVAAEYVDRISKGDIPPKITDEYKGDFNEIKNNLNQCIDAVNSLIEDSKMLTKAAAEGKLDTRADASKHFGDFRAIVEGVNGTLDNVIGPLNVAAEYVDRISKGDIPPRITDEYKGDFNEIKNNINLCIDSINELVKDTLAMVSASGEAKLRFRANPDKHQGDFRRIIGGFNNTLDKITNLLDNIKAPIMGIDSDYNIKFLNNGGASLGGKKGYELEGMKCYDLFNTSDCNTEKCACNKAMLTKSAAESETDAHPAGLDLEISYSGFPIMDEKDEVIGAFEIVMDQTAVKNAAARIEKVANYQAVETDKIVSGLEQLAKGNFDVSFDIEDADKDTQQAYNTLKRIVSSISEFTGAVFRLKDDVTMLSRSAIEGQLQTRAQLEKHLGDFADIVKGLNNTLDAIIHPLNDASQALEIMSSGDLSCKMQGQYKGDLAKLRESINKLCYSLGSLISKVSVSVEQVAAASAQISQTAESLAAASQEQSAQADEVASAVEQMSRTVTDNAMSAGKTAQMAENNGSIAKEGGIVVKQTVTKMKDIAEVVKNSASSISKLGESSKHIGEIISVIDDIADQTNLLALNAAIEAARAGEQGRGFAVVADEVRKLAERTTEATKQIADMIKGIQKETAEAVVVMNKGTEEVNSGIELADKAGASLDEIMSSTSELMEMISSIAAASEEQSATSEQISKNVVSISKVTAESAQRIEEVALAADELRNLTENLTNMVAQFKVDEYDETANYSSLEFKGNGKHLPEHVNR